MGHKNSLPDLWSFLSTSTTEELDVTRRAIAGYGQTQHGVSNLKAMMPCILSPTGSRALQINNSDNLPVPQYGSVVIKNKLSHLCCSMLLYVTSGTDIVMLPYVTSLLQVLLKNTPVGDILHTVNRVVAMTLHYMLTSCSIHSVQVL